MGHHRLPRAREIGLGLRKAYALVTIAEGIRIGLITEEQAKVLGWAKTAVIAGLAPNAFQASRASAYARKHPLVVLHSYMRGEKSESGSITKSFVLSKDAASKLEEALVRVGGRREGRQMRNRSEALMTMVNQVLETSGS